MVTKECEHKNCKFISYGTPVGYWFEKQCQDCDKVLLKSHDPKLIKEHNGKEENR